MRSETSSSISHGEDRIRWQLVDKLSVFTKQESDSFLRGELGDQVGFSAHAEVLEKVFRIGRLFSEADLSAMPYTALVSAQEAVDSVYAVLHELRTFSLDPEDEWKRVRTAIIGRLSSLDRDFLEKGAGAFSLGLAAKALRSAPTEAQSAAVLQSTELTSGTLLRTLQDRVTESERLLEELRSTGQKISVQRYAEVFDEESGTHKAAAARWLAVTGLVAAVTLVAAIVNLTVWTPRVATTGSGLIQFALAKVILFSLLISAVFWCGRVYRAHQHNLVVNRHRKNALSAFQAFALEAHDSETKNAVLLQATQSIFAPQPTGHVEKESEGGGAPQVFEFYRSLGRKD